MCTPLMGTDQKVLGILYVDNRTATHSFADEDLEFLIAFGSLAAVGVENSQRSEQLRREALVLSNFQRYFAPNLAAQIAQQEGAVQLGGTKRPVVIFFSDIRGFTPLSESMGPDEIATLLTEYFTEMVEIVFEHAGTLDKFMGDAIMALWGAPIAHEDDADRAMRCAVDQLRPWKLNVKWKNEGRPELGIGIGINFGEVFASNIGPTAAVHRHRRRRQHGEPTVLVSRAQRDSALRAVLPEAQGPSHGRSPGAGAGEGEVEAGAGLPGETVGAAELHEQVEHQPQR